MKRFLESDQDSKRVQTTRILSEAHIKTVDLLISLSKKLANTSNSDQAMSQELNQEDLDSQILNYTQKPYWPEINRVVK